MKVAFLIVELEEKIMDKEVTIVGKVSEKWKCN